MNPANILMIIIIIVLVAMALFIIFRRKKKGKNCIGCPYSDSCSGECKE